MEKAAPLTTNHHHLLRINHTSMCVVGCTKQVPPYPIQSAHLFPASLLYKAVSGWITFDLNLALSLHMLCIYEMLNYPSSTSPSSSFLNPKWKFFVTNNHFLGSVLGWTRYNPFYLISFILFWITFNYLLLLYSSTALLRWEKECADEFDGNDVVNLHFIRNFFVLGMLVGR